MIVSDIESNDDRVRVVVRPGSDVRLDGKEDFPTKQLAEVVVATVQAHDGNLKVLIDELIKKEQA